MIEYIVEFSLLFAMCWFGYAVFLKKNDNFLLRRKFIITSFLACLFIPLLPNPSMESNVFGIKLPEVTIKELSQGLSPTIESTTNNFSISGMVWTVILFITFIFLARYVISLSKLILIIARGKKSLIKNHRVVHSEAILNPCSFYRYILLPKKNALSSDELDIVLLHEQMHIDLNHSLEKTFAQLGKAILWWHPAIWLFSYELSLVHEYEVDQAVLEVIPQETYNEVLFQFILNPLGLRIVNPFSSNIKKRITMMNSKNEKQHPLKSGLLFFLLMVGGLFIHSCQSQETNTVNLENEDNSEFYEKEFIDTLLVFDTETMKESVSYAKSTQKIFKHPDALPLFPGCDQGSPEEQKQCSQNKLLQFVYKNILYPEEAKIKGIEGVSVVQFVVGRDGYIFDISNVKEVDPSTTLAVNDMMEKMKTIQWIPGIHEGEQVNVQYTLPVKFKLQ